MSDIMEADVMKFRVHSVTMGPNNDTMDVGSLV